MLRRLLDEQLDMVTGVRVSDWPRRIAAATAPAMPC